MLKSTLFIIQVALFIFGVYYLSNTLGKARKSLEESHKKLANAFEQQLIKWLLPMITIVIALVFVPYDLTIRLAEQLNLEPESITDLVMLSVFAYILVIAMIRFRSQGFTNLPMDYQKKVKRAYLIGTGSLTLSAILRFISGLF